MPIDLTDMGGQGLPPGVRGLGSGAAGNPFGSLLRGTGAGGGTPIGGEAGPRGYNALFDPNNRGILGLIGQISGNPTRAEHRRGQVGQANAKAIGMMQELLNQGMTPRAAIAKFVQTEEGMQLFMTNPNMLNEVVKYAATQEGPAPQKLMNVAPGTAVFDPNTGQEAFRNPVGNVQEFQFFAPLANLSPEELQELSRAQLDAVTGPEGQTAKERAINRMVERGQIGRDIGDALIAGSMEVRTSKDQLGRDNGIMIYDHGSGQSMFIPNSNQQRGKELSRVDKMKVTAETMADWDAELNAASPEKIAEVAGTLPKNQRADMVDAAGPGAILEGLGRLGGWLHADWSFKDIAAKRAALRNVSLLAQALRDTLGQGRSFSADAQKIDAIVSNQLGTLTSPTHATIAILGLMDVLDSVDAAAAQLEADGSLDVSVRRNATAARSSGAVLREYLGPRGAWEAKLESLEQGPMFDAWNRARQFGEDVVEGGFEFAPQPSGEAQQFDSGDALRKALEGGAVKEGDRVILNGQEFTIRRKAK